MVNAHIDFGYPWWLSYGHVVVFVPALALLLIALARKWGKGASPGQSPQERLLANLELASVDQSDLQPRI